MYLKTIAVLLLLCLPLQVIGAVSSPTTPARPQDASLQSADLLPFTENEIINSAMHGYLLIWISQTRYKLILRPSQLEAMDDNGQPIQLPGAPPTGFYEGEVEGQESVVRLTAKPGLVRGFVILPSGFFVIEPSGEHFGPSGQNRYVIYNLKDLADSGEPATCGYSAAEDEAVIHRPPPEFSEISRKPGAEPRVVPVRLSIDADFEYFLQYGTQQAALDNLMSTVNELNGFFKFAKNTVQFSVASYKIWTSSQPPYPYLSRRPNTLLKQTADYFENNRPRSAYPRDLGLLFSGKVWDGTTVGLTHAGTLFSPAIGMRTLQYAAATTKQRGRFSFTVAHELGHTMDAVHLCPDSAKQCPQCESDNTIMCVTNSTRERGAFSPGAQCTIDRYLQRNYP